MKYHIIPWPTALTVNDELQGRGLHQFQYEVDVDRYFWHYLSNDPACLNGDCHCCDLTGKRLDMRFAGTGITLYGVKGPDQGIAGFLIDGKEAGVSDLYAPVKSAAPLFAAQGLEAGEHLLKVIVRGERNPSSSGCAVTVDSAGILPVCEECVCSGGELGGIIPGGPGIRLEPDGIHFLSDAVVAFRLWSAAIGLAGSFPARPQVTADGQPMLPGPQGYLTSPVPEQGLRLYTVCAAAGSVLTGIRFLRFLTVTDYNDAACPASGPQIFYQGEWEYASGLEGYILADCHRTCSPEASLRVRFHGRQLSVYGACSADARVMLDGEASVSAMEMGNKRLIYRSPFLPDGEHEAVVSLPQAGDAGVLEVDEISIADFEPVPCSVTLDKAQTFQRMEGFGASCGWTIEPVCTAWKEENRKLLADYLYDREKGIGLNCFRFDLGAGSVISDRERISGPSRWRATEVFKEGEDKPYDFTRQAGQTWMMRAARERGADIFTAYVHSAPFWMNKNGHTQCDPDIGTTNLKEGWEGAFIHYLLDVAEHFRAEKGLAFDYLSPINEPGWKWEYPGVHEEGCRMSREDILRLLGAAAEILQARKPQVRILAPEMETIDALERILPSLTADSRIRELMGGDVSAHSYFTDMFDRVGIAARERLANTLKENGSPRYWQTEYCLMGTGRGEGRDMGMTPALWIAQTIHYDLTLLNACSWQWWLSLSPGDFVWKDGLVYSDWKYPGDEENVIPSKMLWALGQYSRFIRRGALRIACRAAGPDDLLCSAYRDDSQGKSVLVMTNLSSCERIVQVPGLGGAHAYLTDDFAGNDIRRMDALIVSPGKLRLPPRAVMTVVFEKDQETSPARPA